MRILETLKLDIDIFGGDINIVLCDDNTIKWKLEKNITPFDKVMLEHMIIAYRKDSKHYKTIQSILNSLIICERELKFKKLNNI